MNICVFIVFSCFVAVFSVSLLFASFNEADVKVLELRWVRILALQKCVERDSHDHYLALSLPEDKHPCRWVLHNTFRNEGINTYPEWPNITIDDAFRVVDRVEIFEILLEPLLFSKTAWLYHTSKLSMYQLLFSALQNNTTIPNVRATFGHVDCIVC